MLDAFTMEPPVVIARSWCFRQSITPLRLVSRMKVHSGRDCWVRGARPMDLPVGGGLDWIWGLGLGLEERERERESTDHPSEIGTPIKTTELIDCTFDPRFHLFFIPHINNERFHFGVVLRAYGFCGRV